MSATVRSGRGAIGFSSSVAFENACGHEIQIITSEGIKYLVITTMESMPRRGGGGLINADMVQSGLQLWLVVA